MKAKLVREAKRCVGVDSLGRLILETVPAGYVVEHKDAWKLVRLGMARPADEECERAAGMTEAEIARAVHVCARTSKGILPGDWDAYDRGEMDGYDDTGRPVSKIQDSEGEDEWTW